jgi:uncharacterized protein (TIGR00106 family)
MKVIADISVVPIGVGVSLSKYVAACEKVLNEAGLEPRLHAYGTNIQGEWDVVFQAIRRCHEMVHEMGAPRVSTVIKVGSRTGRVQVQPTLGPELESEPVGWEGAGEGGSLGLKDRTLGPSPGSP